MKSLDLSRVFKEMTATEGRILGLDLIRIFAIYYVFVQHGKILVPEEYQDAYSHLISLPIEGVSVFFLLSGFLIGTMLTRKFEEDAFSASQLKSFWIRRVLRILPNYFVVLLLLLLIGAESSSFDWSYIVFCQNLIQDQGDFFKVAWSLSVEMWFYFLFPLLVYVLLKLIKKRSKALLVSVLLFLGISFILRLVNYFIPEILNLESVRKVVMFRLDSMMFGVLAAIVYVYNKAFWNKYTTLLAILGLLSLVIMMIVNSNSAVVTSSSVLNSGGFSIEEFYHQVTIFYIEALPMLFILPVCTRLKSIKSKLISGLVVFTSKLSYAIYLVHACLVLWFLVPLAQETDYLVNHPFKSLISYFIYVLLTLVFSLVLYVSIERPFTALRYKITVK